MSGRDRTNALRLLAASPELDELRQVLRQFTPGVCIEVADKPPKLSNKIARKRCNELLEAMGASDEGHELHDDAKAIIDAAFSDVEATTVAAWHNAQAQQARRGRVIELTELDEDRRAARREVDRRERGERPSIASMLLSAADVDALPEPEPLIGGVLARGAFSFLVGNSQVGKTFFALSMALAVASDRPWLGRPVEAGRVLYLIGEGSGGIGKRARADRLAWGGEPDIDYLYAQLDLGDDATVDEIVALNEANDYALIVYDTLNRYAGDADENSATAMGRVIRGIARIAAAGTATTSLVLHHFGKNGTIRGSSALYASADTVLELSGDKVALKLTAAKQKDAEDGLIGNYKLVAKHDSLIVNGTVATAEPTGVAPEKLDEALQHFARTFSETGANSTEYRDTLVELMEVSKPTARRIANELAKAHRLTKIITGRNSYRLELAKEPTTLPITKSTTDKKES